MNIFISKLVSRLKHIYAEKESADKLSMLRAENSSCTIMTVGLNDVSMGESVTILSSSSLSKVHIGDFSYIANNSSLYNVKIGNFCSIGPQIKIGLNKHPTRVFVSTHPAFFSNQNDGCQCIFRDDKIFDDSIPETTIGADVWIGHSATILGGIEIGTGAIIAAHSVVVKDVPPYAIVGGNPAKIIRYRFSEDQIRVLLASVWWNWPKEKIIQNVDIFSDIDEFVERVGG